MIAEVDDAIRKIVTTHAIVGTEVDVALDAPTTDWAARRNAPTVNLFLYDIREDTRRRENGFLERRDPGGAVISRSPAPRYFKLSYLVSAWTQRPEDEHRLLDALLRCFLLFDAVPDEYLTGTLVTVAQPVAVSVALPPPEDRAFADVWSSLGGELKPSLDIVVTAPVMTGIEYPAGPPVTDGVKGDFSDLLSGASEFRFRAAPTPPKQADHPTRRKVAVDDAASPKR